MNHSHQQPSPESRIDVILDIDLPVVVRFGHTELPLRALTRLGPGSVIDLGRSPDDPVEVMVSDRVIARGEVVVVGGNYGIRILDVVSTSERMRSMEA
jgi:flagellar motor switch protein FliN